MPADWSNQYLREIVVKWFGRSQDGKTWPSAFDRFIFLWIAYDAWASNESEKLDREDIIEWLKTSGMEKAFRERLPVNKSKLERLKSLCDSKRIKSHIGNMEPATLHDARDLGQVMDVLYRVRNNLFHGHKSPNDTEDAEIVTLAYDILSPLLQPYIGDLKSSPSDRELD